MKETESLLLEILRKYQAIHVNYLHMAMTIKDRLAQGFNEEAVKHLINQTIDDVSQLHASVGPLIIELNERFNERLKDSKNETKH